jgi:hypothetical protein
MAPRLFFVARVTFLFIFKKKVEKKLTRQGLHMPKTKCRFFITEYVEKKGGGWFWLLLL